ncbi:hypothetical protein [Wolbachia endosymbiont (group A) of Lasioglossum lativentre]|uniref:hypothetical protein n=1 Tax=Wolbachia endosymbiont (group A) of Lasioglossum lativentre TaxID=2954023 RepID=UPI00222F96C0|nr:hypothetical protein [Wolbachia endosymbiont (group A) of Lasioglossum lativentre]
MSFLCYFQHLWGTGMTPFFFLDPNSQGTGMTKKGGTGTTKWSVCFCHPMIAKKTWSRAGMTPKGLLPSWMETSVSYLDDTFFLLSLGYAEV